MYKMNRRRFIGGLSAGMLSPTLLHAQPNMERKFLFIFCVGGWDQCYLFAPLWGNPDIDMEPNSTLGEENGISFVDSLNKPSVRTFFEQYGDQSCVINGIESRSVAHEACLRLVYAGTSSLNCNDWPTIIAANAQTSPMMPLVTLSGPNFVYDLGSSVVRVGETGQLGQLLDPISFTESEAIDAMEDQWLQQVVEMRNDASGRLQELRNLSSLSEGKLQEIQELRHTIDLNGGSMFSDDLALARSLLSTNASRCVSIACNGWQDLGWDTHAANHLQSRNFEELFSNLGTFMDDTIRETPSLYENLTIVVLSEMGRFPKMNFLQGKTHWTHTSSLLIGSGVRGGQVIGGYDNRCLSQPISLETGEITNTGTYLLPGNIGATLMQLADASLGPQLDGFEPIQAALL
jgi:hypothetical protein